MRPQKITEELLTEKMLEVLRYRGYDGSSLQDLAIAGGLKKASLYHRYPGGKQNLVQSVLDHYNSIIQENVINVLQAKKKKPKKKLNNAIRNIKEIYHHGSATCLYRALSMESGKNLFGEQIRRSCMDWVGAFESIGKDLGLKKKKARQLASDSLVRIQGALVLSNIMDDTRPFKDVIEDIRSSYLGK